jgi:MFS family permease
VFGALRGRDFRLFWFGAFVSNIGSWIQTIALNWLVLELTHSPLALGIVSFAGTVPILALSLIGGVYVDRVDRRRLLRVTQSLLLVSATILAGLTQFGAIKVEYIVIISLFNGTVMALNAPAWQTFIVDLTEPADLPTAIALNSTQFNLSRVVGPSIAGILLALVGAAVCFLVNGLSFVAVIGALFAIRSNRVVKKLDKSGIWKRLGAGLSYASGHSVLRPLILQTAAMTIFGFPFTLLMPVMAQSVLGLDASGYGALMSATGVGAILGSLTVATFGRKIPRGRMLLAAEILFSLSLIGFAATRTFTAAVFSLVLVGFGMIVYLTSSNTTLQIITPDELRGRVTSIWTLVSFGFTPLGSLLAGAIAEQWGAPVALGVGGIVCLATGVGTALTAPALWALPSSSRYRPATPETEPQARQERSG